MIADEAIDKIYTRVVELNSTRDGYCWICQKLIRNWGILLPENNPDDLGFGCVDNKMRIVFFPICDIHDVNTEENIKKLKEALLIKLQEFKN